MWFMLVNGYWLIVRPGGATRRKWGILDGKDESRLCPVATNIELCTDTYGIYGVPQT
jgi:hypothetical protein